MWFCLWLSNLITFSMNYWPISRSHSENINLKCFYCTLDNLYLIFCKSSRYFSLPTLPDLLAIFDTIDICIFFFLTSVFFNALFLWSPCYHILLVFFLSGLLLSFLCGHLLFCPALKHWYISGVFPSFVFFSVCTLTLNDLIHSCCWWLTYL